MMRLGNHDWRAIELEVSDCVHYGCFRYGHNEYHPYETYVRRLHRGDPPEDIRTELLEFLRGYRPRWLDQAIGISLPRQHPLWLFPWHPLWKFLTTGASSGWYSAPGRVPDIITSFSTAGIPRSLLEQEHGWLENTYHSIAQQGYLPNEYGYPTGRLLIGTGGKRACLLLDGNHRVSAISALGHSTLTVEVAHNHTVRLDQLERWPGVRAGFFAREEAESVFMAYFSGNRSYRMGDGNVHVID